MRRAYSISPLAGLLGLCWFGVLAVATALAGSGHGGHSGSGGHGAHSAGGGSRGIGSSRGHAGTTIASAARFGGNAPVQRSGIQVCPIPPTGCSPSPGVNGCRRYCPGHGGYFFGHYAYFDDYWFGQYDYRDTYAAAYQPQIAPDSYYEQLGQQWGVDVKNGSVPKERLIALTEVQMLNIPQHSLTAFRRGFLAGYGTGGETVLAQIIKQAQENNAREPMKNPPAEGRKSGAAN